MVMLNEMLKKKYLLPCVAARQRALPCMGARQSIVAHGKGWLARQRCLGARQRLPRTAKEKKKELKNWPKLAWPGIEIGRAHV